MILFVNKHGKKVLPVQSEQLTYVSVMTSTLICPLAYTVSGTCAVVNVVARG